MTRKGFSTFDPEARTPKAVSLLLDFGCFTADTPVVFIGRTAIVICSEDYRVRNWATLHKDALLEYLKDFQPRLTEVKLYGDLNR